MEQKIKDLIKSLKVDAADCKRFEPNAAKKGEYLDAIELRCQAKFLNQIVCKLEKILKTGREQQPLE